MNILKSFFLFIIGLFPSLPDMTGLIGTVAPVARVLGAVDHFVDLGVVAACVAALFVFANVEFIWGSLCGSSARYRGWSDGQRADDTACRRYVATGV